MSELGSRSCGVDPIASFNSKVISNVLDQMPCCPFEEEEEDEEEDDDVRLVAAMIMIT